MLLNTMFGRVWDDFHSFQVSELCFVMLSQVHHKFISETGADIIGKYVTSTDEEEDEEGDKSVSIKRTSFGSFKEKDTKENANVYITMHGGNLYLNASERENKKMRCAQK